MSLFSCRPSTLPRRLDANGRHDERSGVLWPRLLAAQHDIGAHDDYDDDLNYDYDHNDRADDNAAQEGRVPGNATTT